MNDSLFVEAEARDNKNRLCTIFARMGGENAYRAGKGSQETECYRPFPTLGSTLVSLLGKEKGGSFPYVN